MNKIHIGDFIKVCNKAGIVKDIYNYGNFSVVKLSGIVDFDNKKYISDNSSSEYDINNCELLNSIETNELIELYKINNRKVIYNNVECIDYIAEFYKNR